MVTWGEVGLLLGAYGWAVGRCRRWGQGLIVRQGGGSPNSMKRRNLKEGKRGNSIMPSGVAKHRIGGSGGEGADSGGR